MTGQTTRVGPYTITPETITYSQAAEPPEIRGTEGTAWRVTDADGRWCASMTSEQAAVGYAEQRIRDAAPFEVELADGRRVSVPRGALVTFRGLDRYGYHVHAAEELSGYTYGVTRCCGASAKGADAEVVCRACYTVVDPYLGGPAEVAVPPAGEAAALFPTGRFVYYEGDDPDGFAATVRDEFGFDPSDPRRPRRNPPNGYGLPVFEYGWDAGHGWSFLCPPVHLDAMLARFPLGT